MEKSWVGLLVIMVSLGLAPSVWAEEAGKLNKLYQAKLEVRSEIASFALGSKSPHLAVVHQGQSKGTWMVSVWKPGSETPVFSEMLRGYVPGDPAPVVRFSPDDSLLAIGIHADIELVETKDWKIAAKLARAPNLSKVVRVNGCDFSADGKLLLARYLVPSVPNEQQPVVPYDLASSAPLRIHILTGPVDYLAVGETQGPWFATVERYQGKAPWFVLRHLAPNPEEINRWQITSRLVPRPTAEEAWRKLHFCQGPEVCTRLVGVSTSGQKTHSVFLDSTRQRLGVWEAESGAFEKLLAKTSGQMQAAVASRAPLAAAILPGNPRSAVVTWDIESGKESFRMELPSGERLWEALQLSADGHYLAAQDSPGSLSVYAFEK